MKTYMISRKHNCCNQLLKMELRSEFKRVVVTPKALKLNKCISLLLLNKQAQVNRRNQKKHPKNKLRRKLSRILRFRTKSLRKRTLLQALLRGLIRFKMSLSKKCLKLYSNLNKLC